jgi:hypothetical protein
MAETVVAPTYARCCVVEPAGTPGGLRETVRLMNDDNSMRPVADVLGDLNEMIWDAFPKEWLKTYDRRRYKAEALAKIKRNSLPWMEGGFHTAAWMRLDCKESLWPARWSWLAVYAVTGTSEGHYVHIDLIGCPGDNQVEHMAMVKTFSGWEKASLIAQAAGRLLGA